MRRSLLPCFMSLVALSGSVARATAADEPIAVGADSVVTLAASIPATDVLAALRERAGSKTIRLRIAHDQFRISRAGFDSLGVNFRESDAEPLPVWQRGEKLYPPMIESPVAWDRIDRIQVRRSHLTAGLVTGSVLGLLLEGFIQAAYGGPTTIADAIMPPVLVAGTCTLIGGGVFRGWKTVWKPPSEEALAPRDSVTSLLREGIRGR